ncbi:MAG: hypothetical protein DWQ47_16045 [Acidobacteria bacterium]|nr:MAG: hypothetical protein DWQ32_03445 [Acidobacteriota bacterium]REK02434.1 MAG: hypothetical protein DWQ38_08690 [Acidobacteriota bacterium]REK13765.1 MAG: hypothetical protein DWQ43_09135 [Acidobacteriota bacterium]REK41759.1 MAG: hypothetical protein DWQ47_16045 [Acidobacteriota bacterium]
MKVFRTGVVAALTCALAIVVSGQTKTVTNADLEKYREKRIEAEKDLNENYEELGFSSPEERQHRIEESRRQRAELVRDLRERDRLQAEHDYAAAQAARDQAVFPYPNPNFVDYGGRYAPSYLYYRFYYPNRYKRYNRGFTRYGNRRYEPGQFRTLRRLMRNARRGTR